MRTTRIFIVAALMPLLAGLALAAGLNKSGPALKSAPVTKDALAPLTSDSKPSTSPMSSASTMSGEHIGWQVMAAAATDARSVNSHMQATVGQTAVGRAASGTYHLNHGFWQSEASSGPVCCQQRGDIDDNGSGPDIADLVALVGYMFGGESYPGCVDPPNYRAEADINGDGVGPDIVDLVALVNYMFGGCSDCLIPCP